MKNVVNYTIALILGTLIFYGGSGINLVSYCCGDCRSAGLEVVLSDKCCEIHEHHHHEKEHTHGHSCHHSDGDDGLAHLCAHDSRIDETDCCGLKRIDFESDSPSNPLQKPTPVELDLSLFGLPSLTLLTLLDKQTTTEVEEYSPPLPVCPRVYLSMLTTLLI
ncbi:MAG: hypothetical protein LIP01_08775 [Tannerellaceae bacterium]|nr:hypothetical protein [Tannerellaceae bacterium]